MYNKESLICLKENGYTVLLHKDTLHWAKMKDITYERGMEQDEEFYAYLDKNFLLFTGEQEEKEIKSIYFAVTGKCNLKCAFCSMNSGPDFDTSDELTVEEVEKLFLPQIKKMDIRKFVVTGGEPLVHPHIFELLAKIRENVSDRCRLVFQTNGLLLTKDNITEIEKYANFIEISIENIFENETLLNRMEELFTIIKDSKLKMTFSFVIDNKSIQFIERAIELKRTYDATILFRFVSSFGRVEEEYGEGDYFGDKKILETYKRMLEYIIQNKYFDDNLIDMFIFQPKVDRSCGAYGQVLSIHSDGNAFMCANLQSKDYILGNVRTTSMEDMVVQLKKLKQKEEIQSVFLVDKNPVCKDCVMKYFCPGPCGAERLEAKRTMDDRKCLSKIIFLRFRLFYYSKTKSVQENLERFLALIEEELETIQID